MKFMTQIKMQIRNLKQRCGVCFKPTMRCLANFEAKDEYECYAESYVKCFWGLCDHQRSTHAFISKSDNQVITKQPTKQYTEYKNPGLIKDLVYQIN